MEVDLLIIGSGAAAMAASLRAATAGLSVLVVEKAERFGGSTAVSGGVLWVPRSTVMRRAGSEDAENSSRTYLDACIGSEPGTSTGAARRAAFLNKGPECLDFLEGLGMRWVYADGYSDYHEGEYPGGLSRGRGVVAPMLDLRELGVWADRIGFNPALPPVMFQETVTLRMRGRTWGSKLAYLRVALRVIRNKLGARLTGMGGAMYGRLFALALQQGVRFESSVTVKRLLELSDRIAGAEIRVNGKDERVIARRGVLLNSGGFARNQAMRAVHQRQPSSVDWTLANSGDSGEMITMAGSLGAATDLMDASWWLPATTLPGGARVYLVPELQQPHGIVVDSSGSRYMNEATSYVAIGNAMYRRNRTVPCIPSYLIMDSQYLRKYLILGQSMKRVPQPWLDAGVICRGESLADLAVSLKIPVEGLAATVDRFNDFARLGVDRDFGRGRSAYHRLFGDPLHRPTPGLGTLEVPPFYAMPFYPGDVGTCGGLVTDQWARVLKTDGTVMTGLYAAGNCTATLMGHSYPGPGASIAPSLIFGYIAAEHLITADPNALVPEQGVL